LNRLKVVRSYSIWRLTLIGQTGNRLSALPISFSANLTASIRNSPMHFTTSHQSRIACQTTTMSRFKNWIVNRNRRIFRFGFTFSRRRYDECPTIVSMASEKAWTSAGTEQTMHSQKLPLSKYRYSSKTSRPKWESLLFKGLRQFERMHSAQWVRKDWEIQ
jgi:hypothetical protein